MKDKKYSDSKEGREEFKKDLAKEFDVEGHPKLDKVFDLAWKNGHAHGFHEVRYFFEEYVELIQPEKKSPEQIKSDKKFARLYPLHTQLKENEEEHRIIQDFCRFLDSQDVLYKQKEFKDEYGDMQVTYWLFSDLDIAKLISKYYEVDYAEFQQEKENMFQSIREAQKAYENESRKEN